MSVANQALLYNLALLGTTVDDDCTANSGGLQAGAWPIKSEACRVTVAGAPLSIGAVANSSCVLKSVLSAEASQFTFVINDSTVTIKVFCAPGETLGGVANASLSIPSGQSGVFVRVPNAINPGGDWRAAVIP